MSKIIQIIDDDEKLIQLLKSYLEGFGFEVEAALNPVEGLAHLDRKKPDLVILDVMLPEMDGFEVCRRIRQKSEVPIIMLTARGDVTDRVVGLEMGADDYLPKPFEPRELVARVQAILKRVKPGVKDDIWQFGPLIINDTKQEVKLSGEVLDFTTAEFVVLQLLASRPGRTFSRIQIIETLNGMEWAAFERSVDVLISRLRQKLRDDPKSPRYIRTVRGSGYRFIASRGSHED